MLYIVYKSRKLEKICSDTSIAEKVYGSEMAEKIAQRIGEIQSADTVEMLIRYRIGRCHALKQNRRGQFAMDLIHPYRLVFEKHGNEIQVIKILEIVDYH